ncbi:hypothetical protein GH714_011748 [Hevea brasiliensis]|uniref:Uncharacterized protein n=1 Tax=Hevea brasiliensis TaxID=3981 RepID=A0A6A6MXF3_HEVBR|nr:hypothetical protein GH714_011748 [Hevea brasiliensis]
MAKTSKSAGVPLLNAYLTNSTKTHGVNFAVAGSTALPVEVLAEKGVISPVTNSSLTVQLNWMHTHFNTTCHKSKDCVEKHRKSLFMVGEIGGNDYNYAFFQGKTIDDLKTMVPDVVKAIKDAVVQAIKELQEDHSNVTIVYGDYYNAYKWILWKAALLGFDPKSLQKACCGSGGDYDFSLATMCGAPNVPVCPKPGERISWDGVHSTEKAYFFMAGWLIRDIFQKLQCIV